MVVVNALGILVCAVKVGHLCDDDVDTLLVQTELVVDGESLLVQISRDCNESNVWCIVLVQPVDVVHDTGLVSLDGCEQQQVLQVRILREDGVLNNNLLKELDELSWQISGHESTDGLGDIIRVLSGWERS